MEVSRKKERMTSRLSGCGGWGWQGAGQPGRASQRWGPNGQRNQGHSGEQLPSLVTRLSVFRQEPLGSHNTGAFILTAEMPARGRKGRRGPPRCGFDLSERGAGSILDLLLSTLFAWETKAQRSRQSKMCRCQGQPGHSTDQPGKKLFFPAGDGCLSCFNFFKKLGQIRFLKCCSRAWRCLNTT